jgi:hypothetical protein
MKRKPSRVDWDQLEEAFTNHDEELVYCLDLVTGHVTLEGEGEEGDDHDDESYASPPTGAAAREDSTRASIVAVDNERKIEWMKSFLKETKDLDRELADKLTAALDAENAAEALGDALREHPEGRDRWYLYRSDRVHDLIDDWLAEHDVTPIDAAPWK